MTLSNSTASYPTTTYPQAIVFDLDGTLVDSALDLTATLNWVLAGEGRDPVTLDAVRHMVGRGARVLLTRGMDATGAAATDADLDRMMPRFLAYYGDHIADETVTFDGVEQTLGIFRNAGVTLAVCTNKPELMAVRLLEALKLDHYFSVVIGGDSLPVRKPDPGHILGTLERIGVAAADAIMVGDSIHDIAAAKGADMPVVGVTFGYSEEPIETLGADRVITKFSDLVTAVRELHQNRSAASSSS